MASRTDFREYHGWIVVVFACFKFVEGRGWPLTYRGCTGIVFPQELVATLTPLAAARHDPDFLARHYPRVAG